MDIQGKRVVVTGAAGHVGRHVVDRLAALRPSSVVALDRNGAGLAAAFQATEVEQRPCDITDAAAVRNALEGADAVIHTASLLTRETVTNLRRAFDVNVAGTFNVLEACAAAGVRKLVYASSVVVYGEAQFKPVTEDHPFLTRSIYGAGKVACEMLMRAFHATQSLECIALRYPVIYGRRQEDRSNVARIIPESFERIAAGRPPEIPDDGRQAFDFINVVDVARSLIVALESDMDLGVYNIATGVSTRIVDVVAHILEITGSSLSPTHVRRDSRLKIGDQALDPSKARTELGFSTQIALRDGLEDFYAWTREMRAEPSGAR